MEENRDFNEEEFLKKVESAAKKGAGKGRVLRTLIQVLPTLILIFLILNYVVPKIEAIETGFNSIFHIDDPAEDHDLVVDDNGIFGYTAADFEEAILGDPSREKKLEVYRQDVSDVGTITNTGLLNWGIFTKNQLITYNGTVVYTVDLSSIRKGDILYDEENRVITLRIPHAAREEINIPEDRIQFGDKQGGLLAFGDVKMTAEQSVQIQAEARRKMEEKLDAENVVETADRFAILSVWEIYSPVVKNVAPGVSLEVQFR